MRGWTLVRRARRAPVATGRSGIGRPLRPRPRPQRRLDAGGGQRGDLVGGGHAGAAVDADRRRPAPTPRAANRSASSAAAGSVPSASRLSVVGALTAPGHVPGPRVDRLDLAAVALGRPRVQQHAAARGQRRGLVGGQHRHAAAGQRRRPRAAGRRRRPRARRPARAQAPSPPSSSRTSVSPPQRSSHQARAAASPPVSS